MRVFMITMFLMLSATALFAADERTIIVDRCAMDVIVMETPAEHARGLLGQTAASFEYDGMLFEMNRTGRKYFHTEGMQMPIRIMGVARASGDTYKVVTQIFYAPPGLESIMIAAPDVLEISEPRYQFKLKQCLDALEAPAR